MIRSEHPAASLHLGDRQYQDGNHPPAPNSDVRSTTAFGALKLSLLPNGWASEYVNAPGSTRTDTASGGCGPPAPGP